MFLRIVRCGGMILLTPTIEKMTFLSSAMIDVLGRGYLA